MAQKKKSHKKPQNKAQNNTPATAQSKPYAAAPTTQSKPMFLRIFVLALVALMLLGIVVAAIAQ